MKALLGALLAVPAWAFVPRLAVKPDTLLCRGARTTHGRTVCVKCDALTCRTTGCDVFLPSRAVATRGRTGYDGAVHDATEGPRHHGGGLPA
jgi:hypothetical protein